MSHDVPASAAPTGRERFFSATRGVLALALIAAWLVAMRRFGWVKESGGGIFALGFLLVAGAVGGRVAALFRLPQLTGYLAVGVLSGPYVLELFTQGDVVSLKLINSLALALIALQAGAELTLPMLKRSIKSLSWATLSQSVVILVGMAIIFVLLSSQMPFLQKAPLATIVGLGVLWGAMAVSKAPADTLAILGETGAKGPLAEHALGVVVLLDVVVLILFRIALMFTQSSIDPDAGMSLHVFEELGMELVVSIAAGTTFGLVIALYFWAVGREKLLFTVAAAYGITAFCEYFHYDTLLVFVVAGFIVMNLTRYGHELVETTERTGSAVMIVFFATAGAQLNIGALKVYGVVALGLAVGRIFFTWLSCQIAHKLAGDPPSVQKYAWTSFISQAGVTIGLATIAANQLGDIGVEIGTLVIAVIGINELIGPVAFKIGLAKGVALEAELAEIHAVPEADDDSKPEGLPQEAIQTVLDDALSEVTFETAFHPGRAEAFILLDEDQAVDANLIVHTKASGWHVQLRSQLPTAAPHRAVLTPERGMLKVVQRIGELQIDDKEVDDAYIIDAGAEAKDWLRALRTPLAALAPLYPRIEIERRRFLVEIHGTDAAELARAVRGSSALLLRVGAPDAGHGRSTNPNKGRPMGLQAKGDNEFTVTGQLVSAGQPSEARLAEVLAAGAHIVSLRRATEDPFNEEKAIQDAGGKFTRIPTTPDSLDDAAWRDEIVALLTAAAADDKPVYFHCGSANRTGAAYAVYAHAVLGMSTEEAVQEGKRAGLAKLEERVRAVLNP